jgi:hypothetical protein
MAKLPNFQTLEAEAEFWETHSLTNYLNELEDVDITVELQPEHSFLAIPADSEWIQKLHEVARKRGVSIQVLLKQCVESLLTS